MENSCEVVRRNVDKLNMDLRQKTEEIENKESQLRDVESRIQLSLRFGCWIWSDDNNLTSASRTDIVLLILKFGNC